MWNCDSFDLQYNRIIRKKQVQKQAFYVGVWQNKCGKKAFLHNNVAVCFYVNKKTEYAGSNPWRKSGSFCKTV